MVMANAERFGGAIGVRRRTAGSWVDVTTREFAAQVIDIARGIIAAGLRAGDRVALLSATRYEWSLLEFACWSAGCQTVAIDTDASTDDIEWILADSGANAVVVETAGHHDAVCRVVDRLPELSRIWRLDGADSAVDELVALGTDSSADPDAVHRRRLAVHADDIATIAYPGDRQKRIELTHGELLTAVRTTIAALPRLLRAGNSLLMLLPMADQNARVVSLCCFYARTTLGHLHVDDELASELGVFRPTIIATGAGLLREFHDTAREKAAAEGRTTVYAAAEAVAIAYGAGDGSLPVRLKHAVADRLVYPKLRAAFGGRCVAALTSGPRLAQDRAHFLRGIGVEVHPLEG